MKRKQPKRNRRPYATPRLRTIDLAAREVLGTGCKTIGIGNNVGTEPCVGGTCAATDVS
jgi:hypothetical protein